MNLENAKNEKNSKIISNNIKYDWLQYKTNFINKFFNDGIEWINKILNLNNNETYDDLKVNDIWNPWHQININVKNNHQK